MNEFIEWLSKYLGIEKNPTATIIVSLSVFCLGIIINEILKIIGKFRERRAVREIVRRNYIIFKNYLYEQASCLRLFESLVTDKANPNFNIYVIPCSALDNYREITYSTCFKAFFVGFENARLFGRIKRIQAFDNLFDSLSKVKIEKENMFPIVARFQDEANPIVTRINISMKEAFEVIGDVYITLDSQSGTQALEKWLKERDNLYETCFFEKDQNNISVVQDYFTSVLNFEKNNAEPITKIMNVKEFWNYHHKVHVAINDIEVLKTLVKNTKAYCISISEKFEQTAKQLNIHYQPLFNRKLK